MRSVHDIALPSASPIDDEAISLAVAILQSLQERPLRTCDTFSFCHEYGVRPPEKYVQLRQFFPGVDRAVHDLPDKSRTLRTKVHLQLWPSAALIQSLFHQTGQPLENDRAPSGSV